MFSPELRQKWLSIAGALKPDLQTQAVSPVRIVAAHPLPGSCWTKPLSLSWT